MNVYKAASRIRLRGKHVTQQGQARYPSWASTVPNFNPNRSLGPVCILDF